MFLEQERMITETDLFWRDLSLPSPPRGSPWSQAVQETYLRTGCSQMLGSEEPATVPHYQHITAMSEVSLQTSITK